MKIGVMLACNHDGVIAEWDRIPWRCATDQELFRHITGNSPCIMGLRTWQTLPSGLPGRPCHVLSTNPRIAALESVVQPAAFHQSYWGACRSLEESKAGRVWIVGGASVYDMVLRKSAYLGDGTKEGLERWYDIKDVVITRVNYEPLTIAKKTDIDMLMLERYLGLYFQEAGRFVQRRNRRNSHAFQMIHYQRVTA